MFKAEYASKFQASNIDLVKIRSQEMNYYCNYYMSVAAQSSLVLCFALSLITQTIATEDADFRVDEAFWICLAITVNTSVHCMITSIFVYVYAYGLALNGPRGSVLQAIEGMIAELDHVFLSYKLMIFFFMSSTILSFWIIMNYHIALPCSILALIFSVIWARHCNNIYNRFQIDPFGLFSSVKIINDEDLEREELIRKNGTQDKVSVVQGIVSLAPEAADPRNDDNDVWERVTSSSSVHTSEDHHVRIGGRFGRGPFSQSPMTERLIPSSQARRENSSDGSVSHKKKRIFLTGLKFNRLFRFRGVRSFFRSSDNKSKSASIDDNADDDD